MPLAQRIWNPRRRGPMLAASGVLVLVIAATDYLVKAYLSIGFLYFLPVILSAGFLPRTALVFVGLLCAGFNESLSGINGDWELFRFVLQSVAFAGSGLLVHEMLSARNAVLAERERVRILVETSPAAILTVDGRGMIELANRAAVELLLPEGNLLEGQPIAAFIPQLHHALRREGETQLRATMQCGAHRANGAPFLAEVWFSTYRHGNQAKVAAIVAELGEDAAPEPAAPAAQQERKPLAGREMEVMRLLLAGRANKEIAHELGVSESTVKNVLQQLFSRFAVRTRSQLVRVALEEYRDLL